MSKHSTKITVVTPEEHSLGDEAKKPAPRHIPITVYTEVTNGTALEQYRHLVVKFGEVEMINEGGNLYFRYVI